MFNILPITVNISWSCWFTVKHQLLYLLFF